MPDPVSWKLIEPGWTVVGADGEGLGTVHEVLGDSDADIFNGLHVSPGVLRDSRYVPAERVRGIYEDERVELDLTAEELKRLEDAEPAPPSAEIRADTTDLPDDDAP